MFKLSSNSQKPMSSVRICIFYFHLPDYKSPIEETLPAVQELYDSNYVHMYGCMYMILKFIKPMMSLQEYFKELHAITNFGKWYV